MKAIVSDHPTTGLDYLSLVPDHNLVTGIPELRKSQGALSTLEEDLLTLAAAVFAIDLVSLDAKGSTSLRSKFEHPHCQHTATISIPRKARSIFCTFSAMTTGKLNSSKSRGTPEPPTSWPSRPGETLLFSGGLDSLAAAIDRLEAGTPLLLASHYTQNRSISRSQEQLFEYLALFPGLVFRVATE